ncbi:MAG: TerC family protein [Acidimicrobiia bacterium]|nr:TerC family protein [Acidimicrobiia bacterium]
MDVPIWAWVATVGGILAMLAVDLFVFHRDAHEVSMREAGLTSAIWITFGLSFSVVIAVVWGGGFAGEYLAGYLIEKSLSVDNIFVFALLLSYFAVPIENQHRVLFWGVLGALVFRAIFIAAGAALLENFSWTIFVFGGFLVLTGLKMARHNDTEVHPDRNPILKVVRKIVPLTSEYRGQRFFVKDGAKRFATPMLAVLVAIETTDILFAVDSIPAIFAVTDEPFLVFTSNAFAILGLRALYFLLAGMMSRFVYLKLGLAAVLVFVGAKMLLSEVYHVPVWASLLVIASLLAVSIFASLRKTRVKEEDPHDAMPR